MSRHFRIRALLVGLIIGLCLTQTGSAQSMTLVWKRWNWSILYPVERASSIATQALLGSLGPTRGWESEPLISMKLCGDFASGRIGGETIANRGFSIGVLGIRSQISSLTHYLGTQAEKLDGHWQAVAAEFAEATERIDCCAAARREAESRRREFEYWNYYEACDLWMPGFWNAANEDPAADMRLLLQATLLEDSMVAGSRGFVTAIRGLVAGVSEKATLAAEKAAAASLLLADVGMDREDRPNGMGLAGSTVIDSIGRFTTLATAKLGGWASQLFEQTQNVLARIPVEAIGFVWPD